jgi:hypothetical protein
LAIKQIMGFAHMWPQCLPYLPIQKELAKVPKQWISNVIFSIVGESYSDWVKQRIVDRNAKIVIKNNLNIDMDPAIALAFANSNAISSKSLCLRAGSNETWKLE